MLLLCWIESEHVPDPPLYGPWCPFPHIQDLTALLWPCGSVLCELLAVQLLPAGAHHTQPLAPAPGKAAAEKVTAEGPEAGTEISQGRLWWWCWFRLEPAHSWTSTGPCSGKHTWWQWHGMEGQHCGLSLCLPQLQLGRSGSLFCCLTSLLLWLLSPKPSLMSSSVYPSISHSVLHMHY